MFCALCCQVHKVARVHSWPAQKGVRSPATPLLKRSHDLGLATARLTGRSDLSFSLDAEPHQVDDRSVQFLSRSGVSKTSPALCNLGCDMVWCAPAALTLCNTCMFGSEVQPYRRLLSSSVGTTHPITPACSNTIHSKTAARMTRGIRVGFEESQENRSVRSLFPLVPARSGLAPKPTDSRDSTP